MDPALRSKNHSAVSAPSRHDIRPSRVRTRFFLAFRSLDRLALVFLSLHPHSTLFPLYLRSFFCFVLYVSPYFCFLGFLRFCLFTKFKIMLFIACVRVYLCVRSCLRACVCVCVCVCVWRGETEREWDWGE